MSCGAPLAIDAFSAFALDVMIIAGGVFGLANLLILGMIARRIL